MSHRISNRAEYDDREYAKLRITEIQSILENEDLTPEDEAEYKAEQAMLEKILNPITIKTIDGCNFTDQYEAMTGIYKLMNSITASQPNLRVYAIVTTDLSAIVTSDGDLADANENTIVAEQVAADDGNHNIYKGQESICPLCGGHLDYIDSSPDYLFWHCPTCHADGKEGKSYTPDGDVEFDGYHYDIHHHPEDLPEQNVMAMLYIIAYEFIQENPGEKLYCFLDSTGESVLSTTDENDISRLTNIGYTYIGYFRYNPDSYTPIENCIVGDANICPICGATLTYPDQSGYYHPAQSITWHCPKCDAHGQEGCLMGEFDGCHYDVVWENWESTDDDKSDDIDNNISTTTPIGMNRHDSEKAIKALLESFIDNYINDCNATNMSNDEIHAELCQTLSGIFKPGHLTHLGYPDYELTSCADEHIRKGIHKLIVFKSETDDCIDMVLDVQNWDENFKHEVDIAVQKWMNSDDEYSLVITEHLESVGYIFTLRDDVDVYSDYS